MKSKKGKTKPAAKPTLEDLIAAAHAAGVKVTTHLEPMLQVEISQRMGRDLTALVKTGLFGVNVSDAARRLLEAGLCKNQWLICPDDQAQRPGT